ncbi:MAG: hypothetical protein ACTHKP_08930, partial [Nitrososphaeraceae archaeon]
TSCYDCCNYRLPNSYHPPGGNGAVVGQFRVWSFTLNPIDTLGEQCRTLGRPLTGVSNSPGG